MHTRFAVNIDLGNDAMRTANDVIGALEQVSDNLLARGEVDGTIRDANGNTVGGYFFANDTPVEDEDERSQQLTDAGAEVELALQRLYALTDGDEGQVGEMMYSIDKAARSNWRENYGEDT